jgi:D-alanyl-D-alanine carboxypeptidase
MKRIRILILLMSIALQSAGQLVNTHDVDLTLKIDSITSSVNFSGVVLITKDSSEVYYKSFGYSDLEKQKPMKLDDQFVIGSISKQITAVLVLRAYENGSIELDDKLSKYLPNLKQEWMNEVSVHQLLTHTHGIVALDQPLEFAPGSQFHYSQLGYELLAQILENVTDKTFLELSTELFDQYGLKSTYHPENKSYKHLVMGYEENEEGQLEPSTSSLENYAAAGSFISNAHDLNTWNQLLHAGKLLKKETLALMKTKHATRVHPIFDSIDYGYGLLFKDGEQHLEIGALGYTPGFVSACYYYPETNMNLIVLENIAYALDTFKLTFKVHTHIMEMLRK